MKEKIDIQLGNIQETLLLPLAARVLETKRENGILQDPTSVEVAEKINFNYRKIGRDISDIGAAGLVVRAVRFDEKIKEFQKAHPDGKILTIGAGLDTFFYRMDNGRNLWYDLDLEDSIVLREKLLPIPNDRVHYIKQSFFDTTWINEIGSIDQGLLILVPGVFPYFEEKEIQRFLSEAAPKLKGATLIFDVISQLGILLINRKIYQAGMEEAHLRWGIIEVNEIENWSDNIKVEQEPYFNGIQNGKRFDFVTRYLFNISDFFSIAQIIKLEFI